MLNSDQNGATMIESLSVIAIIAVLGIAGIKLIGSLFDMFKQNMVANEVQEIQKNVASRYRLEGNYSELSSLGAQKLRDELLVPSQMLVNGKIVHRLSGDVEVKTSPLGGDYFDITFKELSLRGCTNLSQINWNSNQTTDLFQVRINDKTFKLPIKGVKFEDANALPVTVAKAASSCKSGKNNTIIWTFQ